MKKNIIVFAVVLASIFLVTSCSTTELTTNSVGWSNYSDILVKDFDVVGVVTVEATEVHKTSPFMFTSSKTGSRVTYADLMQKAVELGADDVINIRVEKKDNFKTSLFDFFIGTTKTYTYVATGTAIKYKDAAADIKWEQGAGVNLMKDINSVGKTKLFGLSF